MKKKPVQKNGEADKEVVTLMVNTPEAFKEVVYHFGMLMAPHVAAKLAGVTNQRIQNLIRQGKFTRIVLFGGVHISQIEFEKWNSSPRKAGRPRREEKNSAPVDASSEVERTPEHSGEIPGNGYQAPTFLVPPSA